jgi:hypothetical protein
MSKFLIRFNTKHGESNLIWRIFENGIERCASSIRIEVPMWSESSLEGDVTKWNVACVGSAIWNGNEILIK